MEKEYFVGKSTVSEEIVKKVIERFVQNFEEKEEINFEFKRTDNSGRDIYIFKIPQNKFGMLKMLVQNAKILLKVKPFEKEGKKLINLDFSYEYFNFQNIRNGSPSCFYVYDVEKETFKEYK